MSDTRRFIELDGLRAVAAVAVLVGHYTATFDTDIGGAPLAGWRFLYGAFGVQLFFLISGYVILMTARRAHRPADFAISRVSRLYPAYWMALALTLAVIAVWPQVPFPSFGAVLVNATMVQRWFLVPDINDVSWTLAVEMQFYILVFALLALTRCHLRRRTVLLALWVWVAIGVLTVIVLTVPVPEFAALHETTTTKILLNLTLAEYAPLFAAGCLTFLARTKELSWWSPLTMLAIAVVISGVLHGAAYGRGVCVVATLFAVVALVPRVPLLRLGPVQWVGRRSYSLYLVHTTVGYPIIATTWRLLGREGAMLLATAAALVVAAVLYRVGEVRASDALRAFLLRRLPAADTRAA